YGETLSVFNGTDPNGVWQLFIMDDQGSDSGVISGGWRLVISTAAVVLPPLQVGREGNEIVLTWPLSAVGFVLESLTDLSTPGNWTVVTLSPPVVNGQYEVRVTISGTSQFFRLHKM